MRNRLRLRDIELNQVDVLVLGAGPAGCAADILLARRSHRVMLVSPETPISGSLPVSIPPSARRVLEELGALDSVDAAGLYPNLGNSVIWADDPPRSEMFSNDSKGYHTDLATLEQILLEVAAQAGVIVHYGHSARSAEQTRTGWSVRCDGAEGSRVIESSWVIDASGRHGVIARGEGRQVDRSTTTLAIIQRWKREGGWPEADRHFTYIESYDTGWAWSVPLGDDLRCYTVMIDQRETELAGCDLSDILDRELQRTVHLGRSREGAQPVDQAWACPASLYKATRYARPGLILAGDAGSFIDPLSSFGVKKALSSGWLAGIVANTALIDPDMTEASVNFFDSREKLVYSRYRESSAPFFQSAAQSHGTSYWIERAQAAKKAAVVASDSGLPQADIRNQLDLLESNLPEADVRAAFDEICAQDRLGAVRGKTLRIFEGPGVAGHRIVMEQRLGSALWPSGMRYVRGVDLLQLIEAAMSHDQVPEGWAAYNASGAAVTLPDYLTALSTAFAAGFLEHGIKVS